MDENSMVVRVTLHNMLQDRDDTVRSIHAQLSGQQVSVIYTWNVDKTSVISEHLKPLHCRYSKLLSW